MTTKTTSENETRINAICLNQIESLDLTIRTLERIKKHFEKIARDGRIDEQRRTLYSEAEDFQNLGSRVTEAVEMMRRVAELTADD